MGAGLLVLALSMSGAEAGTVLVFGQDGISDQFTATNDGLSGAAGGTTLSAVGIPVTVTGIANAVPLPPGFPDAYFNLSATSVSNATVVGASEITQDFTGSFSITSLPGGGGTNYLSGTFADAVFGSGAGLGMTASGPAGVPTFTSDVISTLSQMRAVSLSFTSVTPPAYVTADQTLGAFTANVSGSFSGAPEPTSLVLLGLGVTWLLVFRRRSMRTAAPQ
jgi:hypothetical protein